VPSTDLFYLWTLVTSEVHLNLPFALAMFLARKAGGTRTASPISEGHFVTKLAESYFITTPQILRTLSGYDTRTIGLRELEAQRVLVDGVIPPDDPVHIAQEGAPLPAPERRRRRAAAPQAGPEPEIDLRYLSQRMDDMQLQMDGIQMHTQWTSMAQHAMMQHFQIPPPQLYPPPVYPPFPDWFAPYGQYPGDGAGPSNAQNDQDD